MVADVRGRSWNPLTCLLLHHLTRVSHFFVQRQAKSIQNVPGLVRSPPRVNVNFAPGPRLASEVMGCGMRAEGRHGCFRSGEPGGRAGMRCICRCAVRVPPPSGIFSCSVTDRAECLSQTLVWVRPPASLVAARALTSHPAFWLATGRTGVPRS